MKYFQKCCLNFLEIKNFLEIENVKKIRSLLVIFLKKITSKFLVDDMPCIILFQIMYTYTTQMYIYTQYTQTNHNTKTPNNDINKTIFNTNKT